jgi:hypothetical protein
MSPSPKHTYTAKPQLDSDPGSRAVPADGRRRTIQTWERDWGLVPRLRADGTGGLMMKGHQRGRAAEEFVPLPHGRATVRTLGVEFARGWDESSTTTITQPPNRVVDPGTVPPRPKTRRLRRCETVHRLRGPTGSPRDGHQPQVMRRLETSAQPGGHDNAVPIMGDHYFDRGFGRR